MTMATKTIRMLQVANQPGPFYCFLRPLIFELMRQGVEVDVACNQTDSRYGQLVDAGMHMLPLTVGPWNKVRTWITLRGQLREIMSRRQYDICVVHTPAISWITRREAARAAIPVVAYTAHGLPFFERQGWLKYRTLLRIEKQAARFTDLLLVMNSEDARSAREHRLVKPGGIVRRIPGSGINAARWAGAVDSQVLETMHREFRMGPQTKCVLYMGRLMETKGVMDLVEAAARVKSLGHDISLVVAGTGELQSAMLKLAEERGLGEQTHVLGWRDDVVELMHLADVLVLPSTYREGLPTVLLEAGAAGKPAVAYRNRGSSDAVVDGQTGYLTPPRDVEALAGAIVKLLGDADHARQLGLAGRQRVIEEFDFVHGARAQLDAYAAALEAKGIEAECLRRPLGEPRFEMDLGDCCGAGGRG